MSQQINIRTSEENHKVVSNLTSKLPVGTSENVIARIAFGYSLQTGKTFAESDVKKPPYDSKGKEYKDHILFEAKYRDFYIALICQHYGVYRTDEKIVKLIKLHIDHGLELLGQLFEDNAKYTIFDFLGEHLEKGIRALEGSEVSLDAVKNNNQKIDKHYFTGRLPIQVGEEIDNNSHPIFLNLNDVSKYNNCHIAVAGNSGTGKTQFALEFLRQVSEVSSNQVNFIYLDFKGLKKDDLRYYQPFFKETDAEFINAPETQFPVNPLSFIDNVNEVNKQMGIDKFVDIICKYGNLGAKQRGKLRDATNAAFDNQINGQYPSMIEINEELLNIMGNTRDSLTEVVGAISRFEVFDTSSKLQSFLSRNVYLSLSGDLPNSVRFTSLFLIINYIYNTFMNMENTPVDSSIKAMRYVLLIDEAHVIFKERKYQDILEKMLREIRSKGVSIVLLSQGIEEFNQESFDFSSMCEIAFLLDIKNKTNIKMINKFMGFGENEGMKVARSMEKIETGQSLSNINEFEKGKLFLIQQYRSKK